MCFFSFTGIHWANFSDQAQQTFQRIAGYPLPSDDPRIIEMADLFEKGAGIEAARIAMQDPQFLRTSLRHVTAPLVNKEETHFVDFNDSEALIIGITNDDLDARLILTGNFFYKGKNGVVSSAYSPNNNLHFRDIYDNGADLSQALERVSPQRSDITDAAGILTTRAYAEAFYRMGTNRRAVEFTFKNFLCAPIQNWRDTSLSDFRVRRDVDRAPGGNPVTYQQVCRGCHGPMDAMGGAFARLDFQNVNDQTTQGIPSARLFFSGSGLADKMNQNPTVYPDGHITTDDSWTNLLANNVSFGWSGNMKGKGINAFGKMISESKAYGECWAYRAINEVCRQDLPLKDPFVQDVAKTFVEKGYKIKDAFAAAVIHPQCWR